MELNQIQGFTRLGGMSKRKSKHDLPRNRPQTMFEACRRHEIESDYVESVDHTSSQPTSKGCMSKRKAGHGLSRSHISTMSEALQRLAAEPDDMEDIDATFSQPPSPTSPLQPVSRVTPLQDAVTSQSRQTTTRDSARPDPPSERHGRGCAKGIKQWGTGTRLKVEFDDNFQPLNKKGKKLKGQIGLIVRNPHRVPLTYLKWNMVPLDIKEAIWRQIQDNVVDCPDEFYSVAMGACNKLWKDHKSRAKNNNYKPNKDDPNIFSKVPKNILPDQWADLVRYWRNKHIKARAKTNSLSRGLRGPAHRTGRNHFAQIRHEMKVAGEVMDKMSVFIKTRDPNDPDVKDFVEDYNDRLSQIDEPLRTIEIRDKIFHEVFGEDGHGYCLTHGSGVPRSAVYKKNAGLSEASSASTIDEITRQVRERLTGEIEQRLAVEIEQRLTAEMEERVRGEVEQRLTSEIEGRLNEKFMEHLKNIQARMDFYEFRAGAHASKQGLDAGSGHRATSEHRAPSGHRGIRESVGDDIHGSELLGTQRTNSQQVIREKVCLASFDIPKQDVAEGVVISKDPLLKIDGVPLGIDFWKVLVDKAIKPNALLERARQGVTKVGDAVGVYVAWRSSDVFWKE